MKKLWTFSLLFALTGCGPAPPDNLSPVAEDTATLDRAAEIQQAEEKQRQADELRLRHRSR